MASTSETGNAINVANLQKLISFCIGFGASYIPSKVSITLPALNTLYSEATESLEVINNLLPAYTNAINARFEVFSPLSKIITRVVNAANASDISTQTQKDVKSIAKKLQGKRSSSASPTTPDNPNTPENESTLTISSSQMSFDQRIESMDRLIQLLSAQPAYIPNETDLKLTALTTLLASMRSTNTVVINAYFPVSNARINRDKIIYAANKGIADIAQDVKSYVKSVFGGTSPQYKQISGLKFKKRKL